MSRLVLPLRQPRQHFALARRQAKLAGEFRRRLGAGILGKPQQEFVRAQLAHILQPELLVAGKRGHDRGLRSGLALAGLIEPLRDRLRQHDIVVAIGAKRIRQQFLRLRRRPHDLARAVHGQQIAAGDVERGARALGQPRIGEVDADARQHLLDRNRLCHVVDAAGLQAANDVFGFGQPRHEDDRNVVEAGVALQPPAGFETVHARA